MSPVCPRWRLLPGVRGERVGDILLETSTPSTLCLRRAILVVWFMRDPCGVCVMPRSPSCYSSIGLFFPTPQDTPPLFAVASSDDEVPIPVDLSVTVCLCLLASVIHLLAESQGV